MHITINITQRVYLCTSIDISLFMACCCCGLRHHAQVHFLNFARSGLGQALNEVHYMLRAFEMRQVVTAKGNDFCFEVRAPNYALFEGHKCHRHFAPFVVWARYYGSF